MIAVKSDEACSSSKPSPATPDDQQLIDRLRRGERAALETLITEHQPRIQRLVARLSGWGNDTDDIVQEVFISSLRSAKRFRGDSQLATWLSRIAINACRSHHRKRMVRAIFMRRQTPEQPPGNDASAPIEQRERIRQVTDAVRRLKPKYREVVAMHYLEEMSIEDIAQVLGLTRNMVNVRLHRARKMLEEMLEK